MVQVVQPHLLAEKDSWLTDAGLPVLVFRVSVFQLWYHQSSQCNASYFAADAWNSSWPQPTVATAFCSLSVCLRCPSTLILGTGFAGPTPLDFLARVPAPLLDRVPDFEFFHWSIAWKLVGLRCGSLVANNPGQPHSPSNWTFRWIGQIGQHHLSHGNPCRVNIAYDSTWQGGWGSLMSNATVPTFSHASMRTAIKNMPGMKELMHLHGLLSMMHSSTQHIAVAIHHGSVQFVVISGHAPHVLTSAHCASGGRPLRTPSPSSIVIGPLSVRCTCQDWDRGFRKCWLTWSWWGNEVGAEFYDRCIQSKCVVPQTCHCYHRGPNHAWTHPAGSSARTDFIAIDHILLHEGIRTWGRWRHRFVPDQTRSWMSDDWFTNLHLRKGGPSRDTNVHNHGAYLCLFAYLPHETWQAICWKPCHWQRFCQMKPAGKQAVTCSVLCMVFSRPSWDRRSSLAAPGRCYFCMAYSSSRYPEWLDSYASWPDRSNPSKSGTRKVSRKGLQVNACCKCMALQCWRG